MKKLIMMLLLMQTTTLSCAESSKKYPEYYAAVKKNLKDPESVTFRNEVLRKNGFFCGEYNAKNSYGGYVGYKRFKIETRMLSINQGVSIEGTDILSAGDMLEKVNIIGEVFGERKRRVDRGELKPLTKEVSEEMNKKVELLATERNWKRDCVD